MKMGEHGFMCEYVNRDSVDMLDQVHVHFIGLD